MKRFGAVAAFAVLTLASPRSSELSARTSSERAITHAEGACVGCHAEVTREWEGSAHHRAASDPVYEEAVLREPLPFCRACHAPFGDPSRPTTGAAHTRGIDCVSCHADVTPAHVTAPPTAARSRVGAKPCASCHEFDFPDGTPGMQRTVSEHAASTYAKVACASCHMPRMGAPRHRSHALGVSESMLRSALDVDVVRVGKAALSLRLAPAQVGHAFPTGDLFRRVVVEAELLDGRGEVVGQRRRDLARVFDVRRNGRDPPKRVEVGDGRLGPAHERCFEMDFGPVPPVGPAKIHLEIAYEQVAHPLGSRSDRAIVARRVVLLERDVLLTTKTTIEPRPCSPEVTADD